MKKMRSALGPDKFSRNHVARQDMPVSWTSAPLSGTLREFLEGKARYFGDDVINARLVSYAGFARDVVFDFVERVADGEFGKT